MAKPALLAGNQDRGILAEPQQLVNGTIGIPYRPPMMQGLGTIADLVNAFANGPGQLGLTMPTWSPIAPGKSMTLRDLTVGELGPLLENISYGMGPMRGGNYATGGLGTMGQVDPKILELANAMPAAAIASKTIRRAGDILKKKKE